MNDLITELAKQADPEYTGDYNDDMGHAIVGNEAICKFAELIVKECLNQIKELQTLDRVYKTREGIDCKIDVEMEVLQNFGINE